MSITSRAYGVFLLATAAAFPIAAHAQQTESNPQTQEPTAGSAPVVDDNEIVVTATRQAQSLSKVPISVAAFSQEQMDQQGVRQVDDLVRFTPGLTLDRGSLGSNQISIRGIASSAGAGTTGIYIDDTPIQVRNLGFGSGSAFPEIFDLERVEVLRGPQGTLFGAGSEGGTIRFIQTSPNMKRASIYGRAQVSQTLHGDWSYEGGVAFGAPIIEDKIGFRASVYYSRQGGWIDAVEGALAPSQPAPAPVYPYGNLATFQQSRVLENDVNWRTALTARLALEFRPTDTLTITPSISYQRTKVNESSDQFSIPASNLDRHDFQRVNYVAGPASSTLTALDAPATGKGRDRFLLPALSATLDLGPATLVSNTSYFDRDSYQFSDYTRFDLLIYAGLPVPGGPGWKAITRLGVRQKNFTQEVRLQSTDPEATLGYTVGVFYSRLKQTSVQDLSNNYIFNLPFLFGAFTDGDPFGPGHTAFENYFGMGLLDNSLYFREQRFTDEKQLAGFAQFDLRPVEGLTLTAGLRVSRNKLSFTGLFPGALNNINPPGGQPCPQASCTPGQAPFVPAFPDTFDNRTAETAWTPKFGISYQANRDHLIYGSISKGFRPAGATSQNPPLCDVDLRNFGYVDSAGNPVQPLTYRSDSVWSYEIGAKGKLFGGKLSYDGSIYRVDWKNIQTQVRLPVCLYDFVDNFGRARSEGFDLQFDLRPARGLNLGASIGYNKATFTAPGLSPAGTPIFAQGSGVPGSPSPWTIYLSGQYDFEAVGAQGLYARADYTYTSEERRSDALVSSSPSYNPLLRPNPGYDVVNLRVGWAVGNADISLFANNVFDARPLLNVSPEAGRNDFAYTASTERPRTIGLTLTYRD